MYPKLVSFGSFFIPTYGVLVALGFLLALTVTMRLARGKGLPSEKVVNLAVYCAMAGIAGAKLFMCPCHGGVYYPDGRVAAGPPPDPLPRYPVRVRNGQVEVEVSAVPSSPQPGQTPQPPSGLH